MTVAAIFAHPDDEVLGCGGALALHADRGETVRVLILATGLTSRGAASSDALAALQDESRAAAAILGARSVEFAAFPDNAMDSVPLLQVVQRIETFLSEAPPQVIYTHHGGDVNIDHRVTHQAVLAACRPVPGRNEQVIRACEVNSSTEWSAGSLEPFMPNEFLSVETTLARKLDALACYAGELRASPHPRSIDGVTALARWRGTQSGCMAAEAFRLIRRVAVDGSRW